MGELKLRQLRPCKMRTSKSQPELRLVGGFVGNPCRQKRAREIAQTHFKLGDTQPDFSTTHKQTFAGGPVRVGTAGVELGLRKSHFALGEDPKSMAVESEYDWRFRKYGAKGEPAKLNEEVKEDLRKHHFELGSAGQEFSSTTNSTFTPQLQDADALQSVDPQAIRKHNYIFGTDPSQPQSIMKSDYGPKRAENWREDSALQDRVKDLRSSHFKYGTMDPDFHSTNSVQFTGQPGGPAGLSEKEKEDLRKQHFDFGTDPPMMASQSMATFEGKGKGKTGLNIEAMKELRTTHFKLGHDPLNYDQTSTDYKQQRVGLSTAPTRDGALRRTHFTMGNDPNKWATTYNLTTSHKKPVENAPARDRHADKMSHFYLGSDVEPMQTVAKGDYHAHSMESRGLLDPGVVTNMRSRHYGEVGGDREFRPMSTEYGAQMGKPGSIDPTALKFLRSTHFVYGHDPPAFATTSSAFSSTGGPPSKLDPEMLKDLRRNHSTLGVGGSELKTTYLGAYNWVQPVYDKTFPCTFSKSKLK